MGNSENPRFVKTLETMKGRIKDPILQEHIDWALIELREPQTTTAKDR
jgi:hypothetical protein